MAERSKDIQNNGDMSKGCFSYRCVCITAVISLVLVIVSGAAIIALLRLLATATHPIEFVEAVRGCVDCPRCHHCLADFTGQDVDSLCNTGDLSRTLQCAAQVLFLYSDEQADPSTPCYSQCRPCRNCIDELSLGYMRLTSTLWETVYTNYFANSTFIDPNNYCRILCLNGTNCQWVCQPYEGQSYRGDGEFRTSEPIPQRKKRQVFVQDMDACCSTERRLMPYLIPLKMEGDNDGKEEEWYPVWFYKQSAAVKYSFQYYSDVRCPIETSNCGQDIQCVLQNETQTMLMSSIKPHDIHGYTFIILTYPNRYVQFVNLDLSYYCRCTT